MKDTSTSLPPAPGIERESESTQPAPAVAPAGESAAEGFRLDTILVPVDFSEASQRSLVYAARFAARCPARILLLHVVEFSYLGSEFGALELTKIENDLIESAQTQLELLARNQLSDRIDHEILVRVGRPYFEIIETAKERQVDLVLIASHGHSRLTDLVLGSTVERVLRHSPCPVLIIRPPQQSAS